MFSAQNLDKVIGVLRKSAKRALNLRLPGYLSPYFVSFLVRDTEKISVSASAGSVFEIERTPKRLVYCDCRVGSYKNDQTQGVPETSNVEERFSHKHSQLPLEDDNLYAFETSLWRLTELRYREALKDFQEKQARRVFLNDENKDLASFYPSKPIKRVTLKKLRKEDLNWWRNYVKKISKYATSLPSLTFDYAFASIEKEIKIFVSTENTVIVESQELYSVGVELAMQSWDGQTVKQELFVNIGSFSELPSFKMLKKLIDAKYKKLRELAYSRKLYSFSGPALLCPIPAGLLFHETLGHRLEGDRLLSRSEGLTFKGQLGKKILNFEVTIEDNPELKSFKGKKCWGAYDFDDQGFPAGRVVLVEDGILKNFLSSRSQCYKKNFMPNGHARSSEANPPMSRMGVFAVKAKKGFSFEQLKRMLISEIKRQNKPYGVLIEEAVDGETKTESFDLQTFSGKIAYCKLIYPDGSEEVVRGLSFVGTPLQSLSQIIAMGDEQEMDNSFCVAESGTIPVTTICPALLIRNLELQATEETSHPPYLLPKPRPKN
ncbi:MAG: metallopeptidase TldD-related protein [Deltaproteobacteria bacterium]|nr:metallopeptidase TldD-related protein [Deltaproteobacteria bacterium]MCX7953474.1 metallopeptidase TldD-related protein [Deltaproteobacteria bacterium]